MYNKDELLRAIWNNPDACTGLRWQRKGAYWQSKQRLDGTDTNRPDKSILRMRNGQVFVNYNGGSFPAGQDIWQYLHYRYNTNDFVEVLQKVGDTYGIQPDMSQYTQEQRQRAQQRSNARKVATEVANAVLAALPTAQGSIAAAYLNGRGLKPTNRMGAINLNLYEDITKRLCSTFADIDSRQAQSIMRQYFPTMRKDYTTDKQGAWVNYIDCYQLACPYYNGVGNIAGFWLRCTAEQAPTYMDETGETHAMPKYLFSKDMPKGGYCINLRTNEPTLLVEGMLDAEAMQQAGYTNVMALGGQTPTDNKEDAARSIVATIKRYGITKVIYIPDYEHTKDGQVATNATQRTITALLPHVESIRIANLETEQARRDKTKVDIADYIRQFGANHVAGLLEDAQAWYYYRMRVAAVEHRANPEDLANAIYDIYDSITNPIERQRIKREITNAQGGYMLQLKDAGVNAAALSMIDKHGKQTALPQRMAEIAEELAKPHSAEDYAKILSKANRIQHADTYTHFAAQVNMTMEQMHNAVLQKPDYIETTWALWHKDEKTSRVWETRKISFAPAAVSLIAAPTNHGKTLVLLQTAINLAKSTGKRFLYLSTENDAEQLYIRAITAYIGSAWAVDEPNPRKEVRHYIKAQDMPKTLFSSNGSNLNIGTYIKSYWAQVQPHLALVRTSTDIDALYNNCTAIVEDWENNGVEVGGIFVDYIQQLHGGGRAYSRTDEMKAVCDRLNDLAKALGIPVICAAQFNRDATKANTDKLDGITLANIGESAGIENIAEDCYLVWQVDKINTKEFADGKGVPQHRYRTQRCFDDATDMDTLRTGHLYIENLKARDFATGGYCLLPFHGAAGCITSTDSNY